MSYLAENSLPIWTAGALLLTFTLVVYFQTRSNGALLAAATVVAITGALLAVEYWIETPREQVERTLYALAAAVEANDMQSALAHVAPSANQLRVDIETMMPLVIVDRANILGSPQIDVDDSQEPAVATVQCRGFAVATIKRTGMKGGDNAELTISFVRDGDRWLVSDYSSDRDWRRVLSR